MKYNTALLALLCGCGLTAQAFGQVVEDLGTSGVQDNGTLMGTATLTTDSVYGSGAVHLPAGDGNYVGLTQPVTDLDMTTSYTYMTWFKQETPGQKGLIGLGNCCDNGINVLANREGYTMNITSGPQIRYWAGSSDNDSNHNAYTPTIAAINDGNWHHIAIRVQPNDVDMFFDGVLVTDTAAVDNIPTSPSLAAANANSTNVPKIGGDGISESSTAVTVIDEVRVYGAALSDQDIVAAMNNTGPLPDRLYYTFDDDSLVEPDGTLRVMVTKTFSDDSVYPVDVTLTCNSGLPLEQTYTIPGGDNNDVTFVVTNILEGETDCSVTESNGPDNYTPEFNGGAGCDFENVNSGARSCSIVNSGDEGMFTVNMEWPVGDGGYEVEESAVVTITCDAAFTVGGNGATADTPETGYWSYSESLSDGDSMLAILDNTLGPVECSASQGMVPSGVETSNDCSARSIDAGEESSCTFNNTMFFEGIPTISRLGMAILILLMLGAGFIGVRRLV
jgi:hypothetical protein